MNQGPKCKTIKLLKENIGRKSLWPWVKQRGIRYNTKSVVQRRKKNDKLDHQNWELFFKSPDKENKKTRYRLGKICKSFI